MSATQGHTAAAAHGSQATYYDDSAALYADPKIRLHYPPELYERVYAFAGPSVEAALDVACGTGQCAYQLAKRYKQARNSVVTFHHGVGCIPYACPSCLQTKLLAMDFHCYLLQDACCSC